MPLLSPASPSTRLPAFSSRGGAYSAPQIAAGTIYYVRASGSDGAAGTSPGAAWATLGKALGASGAASGDIIYVGAGTYRATTSVAMTSPTAPTRVIADNDGSRTGDAGPVILSAYTTNDKTAPSASNLLSMLNKSNLIFRGFVFRGGAATIVLANTATGHDIQFVDCAFHSGGENNFIIDALCAYQTPLNWLFDRCRFFGPFRDTSTVPAMRFTLTTGVGADYDANVLIRNCLFIGSGVFVTNSGVLANRGGGIRMQNCMVLYATAMSCSGTNLSTTIPCSVVNSVLLAGGVTALAAGVAGQLVEDYNVIESITPRSNVAIGAHSKSDNSYAPNIHFGQERIWGGALRAFGEPITGSPLLGYGNDGNQASYDERGNQRPSGGASALPAIGPLERVDTWSRETVTVRTGANALSITGPGAQDFLVPVDAVTQNISVWLAIDANYVGPPPRLQLLPNPEIGVTALEAVFAGIPSGVFSQVALTPFTPNAKGVVTLRLLSSDTSGAGHAYADDFAIT